MARSLATIGRIYNTQKGVVKKAEVKPKTKRKKRKVEEDLPVQSFRGQAVCITGKIPGVTRGSARRLVGHAGGYTHPSIRGNTDILVVGQQKSAGTRTRKMLDAERRGILVINAQQFMQIIHKDLGRS